MAFEAAWRAGNPPQLEPYLTAVEEPIRPILVRELVLLDIEYRSRLGEVLTAGDYCVRLPADAAVILSVFCELARSASRGPVPSVPPPAPLHSPGPEVRGDAGQEPPEPLQVRLDVIEGPRRGERFVFSGHESFFVGRSPRAHLQVAKGDRYFSRIHLMVEINPPCCRLCDMGSTNGTKVNGRRVQSIDLADGDMIQGGRTTLRVSFLGPWRASAPPAEPQPEAAPPAVRQSRLASTQSFHCPSASADEGVAAIPKAHAAPGDADNLPVIPGYRLVRELGRGGMGIVYLAQRNSDGSQVAVKTIRPAMTISRRETDRFLREARILQQLRHSRIVSFHESGQAADFLFFVMDYVEGTNAWQILKQGGPLPMGRAVGLVCQALDALAYAHEQGFVHRDVKPSNLLVAEGDECKLADFGLARAYQASSLSGLTMMGDIGGSIPYMPPEQITDYRQAQPPADQYAAAATLYHLLTGRYAFDFGKGPSHQKLAKILCDEPVPIQKRRPGISRSLAAAIHRAMEKDPDKRFPSVSDFEKTLLEALAAS